MQTEIRALDYTHYRAIHHHFFQDVNYGRERLKEIIEKDAGRDGQAAVHKLDGHSNPELGEDTTRETRKPSVNERLKDVLNKPREKLKIEEEREQEKDEGIEKDRDIDRDPGLSH